MRCLVLSLCFIIICPFIPQAQTKTFDLQHFIETLFNTQDEILNYEELYERLLLLYENPLDLNQANTETLLNLYILSPNKINTLLEYIENHGKLMSLYELLYIEGFDQATIQRLLPFVTLDPTSATKDNRPLLERILSERNNYLILRYERTLEKRLGYSAPESQDDTRYVGDPNEFYLRYRVSKPGDFSLGFTMEKDAGEALKWDPSTNHYGPDFWSAHALFERRGNWRKIIIGDYQLQIGQGLIFGAGFNVGKGAATVSSIQRANLGLRPYTSVLEGAFLRGIGVTYSLSPRLYATAFVSNLRQDGNIKSGEEDESFQQYFSSIQLSGLHRTPSEIQNRHNITESIYGFNLNYKPGRLSQFGLVGVINTFSTPILRSNQPYNTFEFSGTHNHNWSIYGNTVWRRFNLFGETGMSKSGGTGVVAGLTASLLPRLDLAIVFRRYDPNFHTFHGTAFAEGSRNINENGVYWGVQYTFNSKLSLSAYYDGFRFPWLRFRINRPSSGKDLLLRVNYQPKSYLTFYFQYRNKVKDQNLSGDPNNLKQVLAGYRKQFLFNLNFSPNSKLNFNTRIQHSNFRIGESKTDGLAAMQDINYSWKTLHLSGRMALFDTQGSNNRQYAYERDVLYAFSIPAYSGRGIRNYLLISFKASRLLHLWLRIARTTFYDRTEIGTGLETIDGNKRTDIKLQLRYQVR